ncbi:homocysteine S-methyltransferase family protein [Candidatus Neomarinimicrobiota bacterium]
MPDLIEMLRTDRPLVADGAMGSMLLALPVKPEDTLESLNLTHPSLLEDIARAYFEAGAQIIQTNTFGGSVVRLADYNLADQTELINTAAVVAVRNVVGDKALVSGSCGPSGKMLIPFGDGDPGEIRDGFRCQISALAAAGVDLICIETMIDPVEVELAIGAACEAAPHIPVVATMTFDPTPRGYFTMMGTSIAEAARRLEEVGAVVVGSNCGNGLEHMIAIGREFVEVANVPVIIQANAGLPTTENGKLVYTEDPQFFAERVGQLIDAGVGIIGGCCGTTPEHIRAICQVVNQHRQV